MKLQLCLLLAALSTVAPSPFESGDIRVVEKQQTVLELLTALGSDQIHENRKGFNFTSPNFYKESNSKAGEIFNEVYKRGILPKNGVFSLFSEKNKKDTFKLYDVFYHAKNFGTFIKIARWAKEELNPLQFSFTFILAVYHRPDTKGLIVPPLYEILPHYFVPSDIMYTFYKSKLNGVSKLKAETNTTSWDWSWYRETTSGPFVFGQKWNGEDPESAISYFREDVRLSDWYAKFMMLFNDYIPPTDEGEVLFTSKGEMYFAVHNWLNRRYKLERYAVRLPPTVPLRYNRAIKYGYNPYLVDMFGRPFLGRQDEVSTGINGIDFDLVQTMESRLADAIDLGYLNGGLNKSIGPLDTKEGLVHFANTIFGLKESINPQFYGNWFFSTVKATNDMALYSNDRELTTTVVGHFMTALRDPIYYMILRSMEKLFDSFFLELPDYSREELNFREVSILNMEVSPLSTRFERFDFEATQGVPRAWYSGDSYVVSQFSINHDPFVITLKIKSEISTSAVVKMFMGPKIDLEYRPLTLTQSWYGFTLIDYFDVQLTEGINEIERSSENNELFEEPISFRELYKAVNESLEKSHSEIYDKIKYTGCKLPKNLMLPLGSAAGKPYQLFAIVYPKQRTVAGGVCGTNKYFDQWSPGFPFDRWPEETAFKTDNMIFKDVVIYHKDLEMKEQGV